VELQTHRNSDFERVESIRVNGEWIKVQKSREIFTLNFGAFPGISAELLVFRTPEGRVIAVRGDKIEAIEMDFG